MGALSTAPPTPLDRPSRPPEVALATWLWLGAVLVGLAASVVALVSDRPAVRELVEQAAAEDPALAGTDLDVLTSGVVVAGVVIAVLVAGTAVGLVLVMRTGRRWARTALVVLGSAWAAAEVVSLTQDDPLDAGLAVLGAALVVAAVVVLATKEAAPFFAPRRRR